MRPGQAGKFPLSCFLIYFSVKFSRLSSSVSGIYKSELTFEEKDICILILDELCSFPQKASISGSNHVDALPIPISLHPRALSCRLLDAGENLLERPWESITTCLACCYSLLLFPRLLLSATVIYRIVG